MEVIAADSFHGRYSETQVFQNQIKQTGFQVFLVPLEGCVPG